MRILDNETDKALNDVIILLTKDEAKYMMDTIEQLLSEGKFDHGHVLDLTDHVNEIAIALYDEKNMEHNMHYTPRVIELIKNDK